MIPSRLLLFTYFAVLCAQISLSVCRADDLNIDMLRKSAEQGDAEAQISLAGAYFKGQGVPQDNQRRQHGFAKRRSRETLRLNMILAYFTNAASACSKMLSKP